MSVNNEIKNLWSEAKDMGNLWSDIVELMAKIDNFKTELDKSKDEKRKKEIIILIKRAQETIHTNLNVAEVNHRSFKHHFNEIKLEK